ncbi:hypothetical protein F7193_03120 [Helicobacter pylori]|nr:hypothetical protein [Helicobacter pylori]
MRLVVMGWSGCEVIDNILITIAIISYLCLVGWYDYFICSWVSEVFWLKNTQINSYQLIDLNIHLYPSKYKNIRFGSVFIGY